MLISHIHHVCPYLGAALDVAAPLLDALRLVLPQDAQQGRVGLRR